MAIICIFNTEQIVDSSQAPFASTIPTVPAIPGYTKPVRLMNIELCSFEIILHTGKNGSPAPVGGLQLTMRWWREFWGDDIAGSLRAPPPLLRQLPLAVNGQTMWSREAGKEAPAVDEIDNVPTVRRSTILVPQGEYGAGVWVTTKNHAPWVRLAVAADAPGLPNGAHVIIYAHVGGHAEVNELQASHHLPYNYNYVPDPVDIGG